MPYFLHPEYPPQGIPRTDLEKRYGVGFNSRVREMVEVAGFTYNPPEKVPNSLPSLFLSELARDRGSFPEIHKKLFSAYWSEGRDIGDMEILNGLASSAGISHREFADALRDSRYAGRIVDSTREAHGRGVTGVPAWLIDNRLLVMGAQPHDKFETLLIRLGYEPVGPAVR